MVPNVAPRLRPRRLRPSGTGAAPDPDYLHAESLGPPDAGAGQALSRELIGAAPIGWMNPAGAQLKLRPTSPALYIC